MIDCTTYTVSNIKPFAGEVLVEILDQTPATFLALPAKVREKSGSGRLAEQGRPSPPVEGLVRAIGKMKSAELGLGDRVIFHRRAGFQVNQMNGTFRLVPSEAIIAKFI